MKIDEAAMIHSIESLSALLPVACVHARNVTGPTPTLLAAHGLDQIIMQMIDTVAVLRQSVFIGSDV
jgi:hypothetical protein